MNKEEIVNAWLSALSEGRWKLLNDECNLTNEAGQHYATIVNYSNRLVIMFALPLSEQPDNKSLHQKILQLNSHPNVIGLASFSLAVDNVTIVLSMFLLNSVIIQENLDVFWHKSVSLRNALFEAITE